MASNVWTIVELNQAKRLHSEGLTAVEIGRRINRPRAGVASALRTAGVKMRVGRPKSQDPWADYDRRVREGALIGSQRLLKAIQRAGVRP